jgi:hypothetical protein
MGEGETEIIMTDSFLNRADAVQAPATRLVAVTPHDSNPLPETPKALYVGIGGDLAVVGAGGGAAVTLANVPDGSVLPVRARIVAATGTTVALL